MKVTLEKKSPKRPQIPKPPSFLELKLDLKSYGLSPTKDLLIIKNNLSTPDLSPYISKKPCESYCGEIHERKKNIGVCKMCGKTMCKACDSKKLSIHKRGLGIIAAAYAYFDVKFRDFEK
ncbi:MAG: hypothetical protein ACFFAN_17260 [Promethearchaeota archaeon]